MTIVLIATSLLALAAVAGLVRIIASDGYGPRPYRAAYDTRDPEHARCDCPTPPCAHTNLR